ncbi:hypothetical protein NGRA_1451 [Nosema granulosis]|uniref:histone acetyltransferase n=1 Tax=Nosema granulosis TaxID=83296 RepID=A0A9P6H165_9MICR|nr:hypothetical protein NGRA_1451 [Nosema granulosis]
MKSKLRNSLETIRKNMESLDGDLELTVSVCYEENQMVFLLFCKNVLSYYVSLQIKNNVCYFDKLDSTGFLNGVGKCFMKAVLSIVKSKIICCFSHPKPAYVFLNTNKNVLRPSALANFWIEVFSNKSRKIHVWSNNFSELQEKHSFIEKGYPFETIEDLEYFEDDPKTRIKENLEQTDIKKLFTTLLCRKDFIEGSLIYATTNESDTTLQIEYNETGYPITDYLVSLDLSTPEKLLKESQIFLEKFKLEKTTFKIKKRAKIIKKEEPKIILTAKRRSDNNLNNKNKIRK